MQVKLKKICFVATIPAVVDSFLRPHIALLSKEFAVTVVCNAQNKALIEGINARFIFLPLIRKPSLWKDLSILLTLCRFFNEERFAIVHSIMPKTGLLAMLASFLTRVPIRLHTFTGQVWVTKKGIGRSVLKFFDQTIGALSTLAIVDSPSQKNFLVNEVVISEKKALVIGSGSICGVDPNRFKPDVVVRNAVRAEFNIPLESRVLLFLGRLNRDKGVLDLASAFCAVAREHHDVRLILVGAEEDVAFKQIQAICVECADRLTYVPHTKTPERFMMAADIFCLPSYREGFGMTIIEAAACQVPTVASRIYGITDAVEEGKTGLLFPAGNVDRFVELLTQLLEDARLRQQMGTSSRERAIHLFSTNAITNGMLEIYRDVLASQA